VGDRHLNFYESRDNLSHDSTPWTYGAFAQAFGDRYRTLRVGERLDIGQRPVLQGPAPARSS
jgi:hypothetical protein